MKEINWKSMIEPFVSNKGEGTDPVAALYLERRKKWTIFSNEMSDQEIDSLRDYLFPYLKGTLPHKPTDAPVRVLNFIRGQWRAAASGKEATLQTQWDKRVPLVKLPDSQKEDVDAAVDAAWEYWSSLEWAEETVTYRKWVIKNFSRMLDHFSEEIKMEIRHSIPKTNLEADKDFWEGKRCADHISGNAEKAMRGELIPPMMPGHSYWKNAYIPAGVSAVITPMNFVYGIPVIQLVGAYMSGSPFIYKGHPFTAISNTSMIRMLIAAGADPRAIQKLEGFGGGIGSLGHHKKVAVVSITGSEFTAKAIAKERGVRTLRFEGGGCNWSWVDDSYSDEELQKIAVRLVYSKLGFSSHKCTTLHGIAASTKTLEKLSNYVQREMDEWKLSNPYNEPNDVTKVIGPNMVHLADTVDKIQDAAEKAGLTVIRKGGQYQESEYGKHAEVIKPSIIGGLKLPEGKMLTCDWDNKGVREFNIATTEFFMPILLMAEVDSFEDHIRFCLLENSHDLTCSLWTRDDAKLQLARRVIGGMLKENDGTDSALDWEEFGASGVGDSGNMGVGDAESTISIFCRRQKGRHVVF